jgi:hypothetical protein
MEKQLKEENQGPDLHADKVIEAQPSLTTVQPNLGLPVATSGEPGDSDPNLTQAIKVLTDLLKKNDGTVGTRVLSRGLENQHLPDVPELVNRLKVFDFDSPDQRPVPFRWYHLGRSFLTESKYREAQASQEEEAEKAEEQERIAVEPGEEGDQSQDEVSAPEKKKRRAEERRMGTYIKSTLVELYDSEYVPDDIDFVFDVSAERSGGDFENVDLLAIHWRSTEAIDFVSVEVKLRFGPHVVQQARNYCRFSERVWIAVPVDAKTAKDAATELRAADPLLFDHVVEIGLGILVCRRGQGGAYEVFPIHWPRRNSPDSLERSRFVERYRSQLQEAEVLPKEERSYPRLK